MGSVGDIVISVFADVGLLVREMERGKAAVGGFAASAATKLDKFGSAASSLGRKMSLVTAGMVAAAGAAFALTKSAADAGDRVANTSRRVGVSAEYFQEMAFAVGQVADVTEDEFGNALTILNRKLGEAQQGSASAVAAFEAVGISQADIAAGTVTTEEAFDALIGKLGETKDPAIAAAVATDLLGKQGARMGGLLAGASGEVASLRDRANELGIVMSDEAVAASEQFGDQMTELQRSMEGLKIEVASVLLPILVDTLIPALTDKVIPAIGKVIDGVGEWIEWFQALPGPIQEAAGVIATVFAVAGPILMGVGAVSSAFGLLVAATGPVGLFIAAAALAVTAWVTWGEDIKAAVGGAIDWIGGKFQAFLDFIQKIIDKAREVKDAIAGALTGSSVVGSGAIPQDGSGYQGMAGAGDEFGGGMFSGDTDMSANGAAMADGLVNGFTNQMIVRTPEVEAAINAIPQTTRDILGIQSPSVVFHKIGGFIGEGLANGIAESQALVAEAMRATGGTAVAEGESTVSSILGSMSTLFKGSKGFAIAQAIVNIGQGLTEALKLPFPQNIAAFAATAAKGASALASIKSANPGGGSLPGGGGGTGGAASTPPRQAAPPQPLDVRISGIEAGKLYSGAMIDSLIDGLSKAAGDRGMTLMVAQ